MDIVGALGPDPCRSDRSAPCHYFHLKMRALNGERDTLSDEELKFVGVGHDRRASSGRWHEPETTDLETSTRIQDVPGGQQLGFLG